MAFSKSPLYPAEDHIRSGFAKALSHPARLQILVTLLSKGPLPVQVIAEGHPICRETFSEHLKILREAHLINAVERFPYTFYELQRENMRKAKEYLDGFLKSF